MLCERESWRFQAKCDAQDGFRIGKKSLVSVVIEDHKVTIIPRGIWKLWSFSRRQEIPFEALTGVQISSTPLVELPTGLRIAGLDVVAFLAGYFQNSGKRSWWCYRNGQSALVLRTNFPRVATFVVSTQQNDDLLRQLHARMETWTV